jgi:hypothetical protein
MYGFIRPELLHIAISTLPWAVQLRGSYDTISSTGGFSESDLVVLTNTLNQDLSCYDGPDVELAVSHGGYPTTSDSRCSHLLGRF